MTESYVSGRTFASLAKPLAFLVFMGGLFCSLCFAARCAQTARGGKVCEKNPELEALIKDYKNSYTTTRAQVAAYLRGDKAGQTDRGEVEFRITSCDSQESLEEQKRECERAALEVRQLKLALQGAYRESVDFLAARMREHVNKALAEKLKTVTPPQEKAPRASSDAVLLPGECVLDIGDKEASNRIEALGEITKTLKELNNMSAKEDSRMKVKGAMDEVARGVKFIDNLHRIDYTDSKEAKERREALLAPADKNRIEAEVYIEKLESSKRQFAEALCSNWIVDKNHEKTAALLDAAIATCKNGRKEAESAAESLRNASVYMLVGAVVVALALLVLGDVFKSLFDLSKSSQELAAAVREGKKS